MPRENAFKSLLYVSILFDVLLKLSPETLSFGNEKKMSFLLHFSHLFRNFAPNYG